MSAGLLGCGGQFQLLILCLLVPQIVVRRFVLGRATDSTQGILLCADTTLTGGLPFSSIQGFSYRHCSKYLIFVMITLIVPCCTMCLLALCLLHNDGDEGIRGDCLGGAIEASSSKLTRCKVHKGGREGFDNC